MRMFFDTEFIELGPRYPIQLVSIGVACEDGREYYAEVENAPLHMADDWFRQNVQPHLHASAEKSRHAIATDLLRFMGDRPVLYGYFADYDHVCLAQLFGRMIDMPHPWPKYTLDIKQVWLMLGKPELPKQINGEHHALNDARWNREAFCCLDEIWFDRTGGRLP